jgi:hypothetical protein
MTELVEIAEQIDYNIGIKNYTKIKSLLEEFHNTITENLCGNNARS